MKTNKAYLDRNVEELDAGNNDYINASKIIPHGSHYQMQLLATVADYPRFRANELKYWATLPPGAKGSPTPPNE